MTALILNFFKLEMDIAKKYHFKILFNFFHIACVIALFHYISKTFGVIEILNGPYFPFVASGLAFNHLASGIVASSSNKIIDWRDQGVLEGLLLSPVKPWKLYLSAGFLEASISILKFILILSVVGIFFSKTSIGLVDIPLFLFSVAITIATSLCFSLIETSSFLLWKKISIVSATGSLFALFLSGVYFPVNILPPILQKIALLNPFFHSLLLIRKSLGISSPDLVLIGTQGSALILSIWLLVALALAISFYHFSERQLFKNGSHSHM